MNCRKRCQGNIYHFEKLLFLSVCTYSMQVGQRTGLSISTQDKLLVWTKLIFQIIVFIQSGIVHILDSVCTLMNKWIGFFEFGAVVYYFMFYTSESIMF